MTQFLSRFFADFSEFLTFMAVAPVGLFKAPDAWGGRKIGAGRGKVNGWSRPAAEDLDRRGAPFLDAPDGILEPFPAVGAQDHVHA